MLANQRHTLSLLEATAASSEPENVRPRDLSGLDSWSLEERAVFEARVAGKTRGQIARMFDMSVAEAHRVLQRCRNRLQRSQQKGQSCEHSLAA